MAARKVLIFIHTGYGLPRVQIFGSWDKLETFLRTYEFMHKQKYRQGLFGYRSCRKFRETLENGQHLRIYPVNQWDYSDEYIYIFWKEV